MGVKDLWTIVTPLGERKPLYELHGKAVAIDLSGWIVDSQTVTDKHVQPKMYLRNLFFRTSYLLQQNIFPVFVLEGTAPGLKHKTIAKRNEIRNEKDGKTTSKAKGTRNQFKAVLRQCEQMLNYMGLFCLPAAGEAEAMCAYLDQDGLVDGCISQDSDCFLYGARTVYRNFCTKSQGNGATCQGSIDVYTMDKIEQVLGIGRNKMVALALLCGCDYSDGVNGIGKEAALKLFKTLSDEEVLERLKSWRTNRLKFERLEKAISDVNLCQLCGHAGKARIHQKKGCEDCGTSEKCHETFKESRALINNELTMRKRALQVEDFPSQEIIDEFLVRKDTELSRLLCDWKQPVVHKFVEFMTRHLAWEPEYAFAKIFPLMIQWQLKNLPNLSSGQQKSLHFLIPKRIHKIRRKKGILCYEVIWQDEDGFFDGLTLGNTSDRENDDENSFTDSTNELVSIETQESFEKCYPDLVQAFEESRKPKKATKKRKKKDTVVSSNNRRIDEFLVAKNSVENLATSLESLCLTPKVTPKRKKRIGKTKINPQLSRVLEVEQQDEILNGSLDRFFKELADEDEDCEKEEMDMSAIVYRICGISQEEAKKMKEREKRKKEKRAKEKSNEENAMEIFDENYNNEEEKEIKIDLTLSDSEDAVIDLTQDEFDIEYFEVPLKERLAKKKMSIGIDDLLSSTMESSLS